MKNNQLLSEDKFWGVVNFLGKLESEVDARIPCSELALSLDQLKSFLNLFKSAGHEITLTEQDGRLHPPKAKAQFNADFDLVDWLEFQAHYPALSPMDIFEHTSLKEELGDEDITILERTIVESVSVHLTIRSNISKELVVLPRKIVYVDEELCLVGERISDQSLVCINCDEIENIQSSEDYRESNFSQSEVHNFVSSMRSLGESSVRLVLKIFSYDKFQMNLEHQFFENPCVFTNHSGELIWAATVEPNNNIYEWLISLGGQVEIFESHEFKQNFLNYCETKLKKLA